MITKKFWLFSILVCTFLASCDAKGSNSISGTQTAMQVGPSEPVIATSTPTPVPSATLTPTVANTATLTPPPSRTPTPTSIPFANAANLSTAEQRILMNLVIDSGKWEQLALSEPISLRWQEFARGEVELDPEETRVMSAFLAQWGELTRLLEKSQLKNKAHFQFRTSITAGCSSWRPDRCLPD